MNGQLCYRESAEGFILENEAAAVRCQTEKALCEIDFKRSGRPAVGSCGFEFRYRGKIYRGEELSMCSRKCYCEHMGGESTAVLAIFLPSLTVRWRFTLSERRESLLVRLSLEGQDIISSNYMCPLRVEGKVFPLGESRLPRLLYVPYDNDKWIRYKAQEFQACGTSYELTAVYDDDTRNGYVIGSVTHDHWKTGIVTHGGYGELSMMRVFGGVADTNTRDPGHPHGAVRGKQIESPAIMLLYSDDFREGLRLYGLLNAEFAPPPAWDRGVIFGWNSWACLTTSVSLDAYLKVSETFDRWKTIGFSNSGEVYVNFDSFWDRLTPQELLKAVDTVHSRGQKAGIYYTPFTCWTHDLDRVVEDTDGRWTWRDLILRDEDDNPIPPIAGGFPVDPTHPGNLMRVERRIRRFIDMGFDYLKVDFMSHGACEGVHWLRSVTTGVEAYRYGLEAMCALIRPETLKRPFFLDFSIAPLFPHGYAHARRISCDSFGQIYDTEYMLNSLTYSFWQNGTIYPYTDPDHTCLYHSVGRPVSETEEARSRLLASAIGGTVLLLSDDYRDTRAVERTEALLTPEYLEIARRGEAFLPVECFRGESASRFYTRDDGDRVYLAVFNFEDEDAVLSLPVRRIPGIPEDAVFTCTVSGFTCAGPVLSIPLPPRGCALMRYDRT
ncbi:MAG: alpha-galactosidase [Clostridia bacterium]|nr:alpha-galactosidase [Clostridia bacterium]